ncbi:hypothetical protein VTH06DRAFT_4833 [Thermothelomyces fergusii]
MRASRFPSERGAPALEKDASPNLHAGHAQPRSFIPDLSSRPFQTHRATPIPMPIRNKYLQEMTELTDPDPIPRRSRKLM